MMFKKFVMVIKAYATFPIFSEMKITGSLI